MIGHTKGPWSAEFYSGTSDFYKDDWVIKDASGGEMMGHTPYYPWVTTNPADVTLIAAAPEMLEALRELLDACSKPDGVLCCSGNDCMCMGATVRQLAEHNARAAISKAKGKAEGINSTNKVD